MVSSTSAGVVICPFIGVHARPVTTAIGRSGRASHASSAGYVRIGVSPRPR